MGGAGDVVYGGVSTSGTRDDPDSPFLAIPEAAWVASNALAFAIRDGYAVTEGHTLVIPRRVVPTWFDASAEERTALFALVDAVKADLDRTHRPDGYNVGFNAGEAAGQTVMHLHVHVIPRYRGDMDDPRGGVRHVIPSKGNYLAKAAPLTTGTEDDPFSRHLFPLLTRATTIDVVAAFVQVSGLDRVRRALDAALVRGGHVRILTGDYLAITQVGALEMLLDWQVTAPAPAPDAPPFGTLEARVIEVEQLPGRTRAFHPKAWRFEGPGLGVAYVGSSNLSFSALDTGIEWNLRVDRDRDAAAWEQVGSGFEALWRAARPLDAAWIADYATRARVSARALPPEEAQEDPVAAPDAPHEVQVAALAALREARAAGRRRALVVLATGLGKTWLAVLDYVQLWEELGRRPRLLFVVHRREILRQAVAAWRRVLHDRDPAARVGWFLEAEADLDADLVFASVAKLSRPEHRARLAAQRFDYVVVDEVHHAAAASYRHILAALDPVFLLGLTATPDRADSANVLGLFDDFVAYRAGIDRGIAVKRLVPFRYFGVRDEIDYTNIPWRNARFDLDSLAAAAATEARMSSMWKEWTRLPRARTLVFCCSVVHARYVKRWLLAKRVRTAAVYSESDSDDRDRALTQLASGELDAVCAVDVFNEGVDVPEIDRVVMLRPTESGVVFLQQLGRGLRAAPGKEDLTVIDFVGNHRMFVDRMHTLLSMGAAAGRTETLDAFFKAKGPIALPAGCFVDVELEAKKLLEALILGTGALGVERAYRELRTARDERPQAGELLRMGYSLDPLRRGHRGWFDFVASEGDLPAPARTAWEIGAAFLRDLEVTPMTRSFKMVTLQVLLDDDVLFAGAPLDRIATRAWALLRRSPELLDDVPADERPDGDTIGKKWLGYWGRNPIAAWTTATRSRAWFRLDGDRFALDLGIGEGLREPFAALVRELVELRLLQYRRRRPPTGEGFVCRVTWNQRDPILALPRGQRATVPQGETDVRLPDGAVWQFRFAKEFCNVARPIGEPSNQLPELLRGWFGADAGAPGRVFQVRFVAAPDGLWVAPLDATAAVIELPPLHRVVAYPDLRAAAGHAAAEREGPEASSVALPVPGPDPRRFAVRAAGTSMDGGPSPIHDGDWVILRLDRGASADHVEGRVALVELPGAAGERYVLKRIRRDGGAWVLASDNPEGPTFDATDDMLVVARLDSVVRPEDLAPAVGSVVSFDTFVTHLGGDPTPPATGRYGGHLVLYVGSTGVLDAPDQVDLVVPDRRPAETAYVVVRVDDELRYLGVGRWRDDIGRWQIPEVSFATWRALDGGRTASRVLPEGALGAAQAVVNALLRLPDADRWVDSGATRGHLLGAAPRGGVRLHGGDGGFAERTVSLTDLAWVAAAADDVATHGGVLDADRVNRVRYLDGTPKGSTRWIDTPWAVALWRKGWGLLPTR